MAPPAGPAAPPATVFVYGTLREPSRVAAVVDDWRDAGAAVLRGMQRVAGTYPTLAPGGRVDGRLLRTPELERLDAYEGVDRGLYVRVAVPVERAGGPGAVSVGDHAFVYVGDSDRLDAPTAWPGGGSFGERIRRYVEANEVAVTPTE